MKLVHLYYDIDNHATFKRVITKNLSVEDAYTVVTKMNKNVYILASDTEYTGIDGTLYVEKE